MNKGILLLIVLGMGMLVSVGGVSALALDYLILKEPPTSTPKEIVDSGAPVGVDITLIKNPESIRPQNATLNISLELVNPTIKLTIDDVTEVFFNEYQLEKELDTAKVALINIKIDGEAQTVKKKVRRTIVDVRTHVYYDPENRGVEEEVSIPLYITNPTIEEAVDALEDANDKYSEARSRLYNLETRGADVTDLKTRLQNARSIIDSAEHSHDIGQPIQAKRLAENAIELLNGIIDDAKELERTTAQTTDIKRYLTIAATVIIVLAAVMYLRGRREELG
ncbi:MAG: hypothetical protein ACE5PM_03640 [Candidatus Hydrothermarchaeales archaeon]